MRKSLKQIVTDIDAWVANHKTLKSFGFGDLETLFKSENHTYQKLWLMDVGGGINGESYQVELNFRLWVMDIQNSSNELDVLSDCLQVTNDFLLEFLEDSDEDYGWFVMPDSVRLEPFREIMNDTLSGYAMEFTVNCGGLSCPA